MAKKAIGEKIDVKVCVNPNGTATIRSNGKAIGYTVKVTSDFMEMVGHSTIAYFRAQIVPGDKVILLNKITNKRW